MKVVSLKLIVDGVSYVVPTFQDSAIQISKKVASFDALADIGTVTKQTFRVPYTSDLINAIGDLTDSKQSLSVNPNKEIEGTILIDGYPVFNGSFQIIAAYKSTSSNTSELELLFSGRESNLKAALTNILLTDLFEDEELPYTYDEINTAYADAQTYIDNNGYWFPLIDYGQNFTNDTDSGGVKLLSDLDVSDFKPVIQLKKIFELLESKENIRITFDNNIQWLIDEQFINLSVGNTGSRVVLDTTTQTSAGYTFRNADSGVVTIPDSTPELYNFNQVENYNNVVFNALNDSYTVQSAGVHEFNVNLFYRFSISSGSGTFLSRVLLRNKTTGVTKKVIYSRPEAISTLSRSRNVNISFSFNVPTEEEGDEYGIYLFFNEVGVGATSVRVIFENGSRWTCLASPAITATSKVLIGASIQEELTAWDVLKSVVYQSNALVNRVTPSELDEQTITADSTLVTADTTTITADNDVIYASSNNYNVIAWKDWIDAGGEFNLNEKLIDNTDIKVESFSVEGAKKIEFKYAEGKDFYNEKTVELLNQRCGEFRIKDTGTDFATKKIELEVPLISTQIAPIPGSDASIPKLVDEDFEPIEDQTHLIRINIDSAGRFQDTFTCNNRFAAGSFEGDIYIIGHWRQLPRFSNLTNGTTEFKAGLNFFTNYSYPINDLYTQYWKGYIENTYTENARKIKVSARLKSSEFEDLQFNERVLFNGSVWRIINIEGFSLNNDEPCTIELMKRFEISRLDIAPYYPTNIVDGWVSWANSDDNSIPANPFSPPNINLEIQESCKAYGFRYDSRTTLTDPNGVIATNGFGLQVGQILI